MEMPKNSDAYLVSFSFNDEDPEKDIMIVGQKTFGEYPDIVNAIQGPEVRDIYEKISGKAENHDKA